MNKLMPEVSAWYQDLVSGNLFEVVAYDEEQRQGKIAVAGRNDQQAIKKSCPGTRTFRSRKGAISMHWKVDLVVDPGDYSSIKLRWPNHRSNR